MRAEAIIADQVYHICNRSVEGINIFANDADAKRFLDTLFYANNRVPITISDIARVPEKSRATLSLNREPIVEIYSLILMPNHFHICARSLIDNGISIWMQRVCNSHARYYNLKYNRKGTLFMSRFQCISVVDDRQLAHLLVYIHANALDLCVPQWREGVLTDWKKAIAFLSAYRWSSYGLFTGKSHVPEEIKRLVSIQFPRRVLFGRGSLDDAIKEWGRRHSEEFRDIFLE